MTEWYKIRVISFYCLYCTILFLFTSFFFWFDAGLLISWFRLLLLLVLPVPFFWCSKEKQLEKEKKKGKLPPQSFWGLIAAGIFVAPASAMSEKQDNFWLSCLFFAAAMGLYFAGEYLGGRYLLLYCNPSVSAETRQRCGKNMKKYLLWMAAAGVAALVLVMFVIQFEPELPERQRQKTNTVQQETDRAPDKTSRNEEIREKIRQEEEKESNNLFLVILRYILFIAIVAMGAVVLGYALFRLINYLIRGRRRPVWEFEEVEVEKSDNEIYTRLVPVTRNRGSFPDGNDGKIRKQFYKEVRRNAGNNEIVCSHTPMELKEDYLTAGEKDAVLTELYEKARYAAESVTEEEIRRWESM